MLTVHLNLTNTRFCNRFFYYAFKSMQELARAQVDPRYRSGDKAYHEEIDRRLSVSNI